ncbi:TlpA disulfide reductase family protein [Methylopila sp. M107]|uniref:thiol:disulfide interchange protein TlpA n=1 Tax=Methylopila sp. M107 TaxID=1101190 RepID=UPI0003806F52|nr:TlpA disulfide reductase family protein [Methylopila sp. M107]
MSEQASGPRRPFGRPILLVYLAALGIGGLALYGIDGDDKARACAASPETLAAIKAAAKGEVAAVATPSSPRPIPQLSFKDAAGADVGLEKFKGKVVLLNLWATWCAPCRKEMPALDQLQAEMGGDGFEVVPVSLDFGTADKPKKFLADIGTQKLPLFHDPSGKVLSSLKAVGRGTGLPTTLILDRAGCEIGYLPGPAEWASPEAKDLVRAALGK